MVLHCRHFESWNESLQACWEVRSNHPHQVSHVPPRRERATELQEPQETSRRGSQLEKAEGFKLRHCRPLFLFLGGGGCQLVAD